MKDQEFIDLKRQIETKMNELYELQRVYFRETHMNYFPPNIPSGCNCGGKIIDTGYCSLHDRHYKRSHDD